MCSHCNVAMQQFLQTKNIFLWHIISYLKSRLKIGLPNNSYRPITNTAWVRAGLCKLQKRVHSGNPASSTTKTGRHDIAEIKSNILKITLIKTAYWVLKVIISYIWNVQSLQCINAVFFLQTNSFFVTYYMLFKKSVSDGFD